MIKFKKIKKVLSIILLIFLIILLTASLALTTQVENKNISVSEILSTPPPTLLPNNRLYFLLEWWREIDLFFTFSDRRRLEKQLDVLNERISETEQIVRLNHSTQDINQAFTNYQQALSRLKTRIINTNIPENTPSLNKLLNQSVFIIIRHQEVLDIIITQNETLKETTEIIRQQLNQTLPLLNLKTETPEQFILRLEDSINYLTSVFPKQNPEFRPLRFFITLNTNLSQIITDTIPIQLQESITNTKTEIEGRVEEKERDKKVLTNIINFQDQNNNSFTPENLRWINVMPNAPWIARDSGEVFLFQNKIWLIGGLNAKQDKRWERIDYSKATHFNDIWQTANGVDWTQVSTTSNWLPKRSMSVVYFNNKLWMFGGWSPVTKYNNGIWTSEDGINWEQRSKNTPWPAREGQAVTIFQDKIWLIGGVNLETREVKNDVWYSNNGIDWQEVKNIPWQPRWDHAIEVFNGKIFLTGGMNLDNQTFNDVWTTNDGLNWIKITEKAQWASRQGHSLKSYQNKLWLISRLNDEAEGGGDNDVWFSKDGLTWQKTNKNPRWAGREDFFSVVFLDRLWVFGGMDSNWRWRNDIWVSDF